MTTKNKKSTRLKGVMKTEEGTFRARITVRGVRTGRTFKRQKDALGWLSEMRTKYSV
jgi:hypothetical protein